MKSKDDIMSGYKAIFEDGYRAGRASVVLPHPCDGELYKDWLLVEYIAKVLEEAKEVVDAYIDLIKDPKNPERIKHLAGECTDVQVAATGVMHKLGYGEEERQRVMKEINESNAKRDGGKRFKKHPLDVIEERFYKGKTISASKIQLEEKTKHDGEDFEIGEVVKVECVTGEKEAIVLGKSKAYPEEYDISINGYHFSVSREWLKKVEKDG